MLIAKERKILLFITKFEFEKRVSNQRKFNHV